MAIAIHSESQDVHGTKQGSWSFDNTVRTATVVLNGWELNNNGEWTTNRFNCYANLAGTQGKIVNYNLGFEFADDSHHSNGGKVYFTIIADLESA